MTKEIISEEEQFDELAERLRAIRSESVFSARMTLLEGKHKMGQEIATDPLYQKHKKGTGALIERIAERIGGSEQDLYLCIQFYQKYPDVSTVVESLPGKKNELTWAGVRRLLSGAKQESEHTCEWEKIERCRICKKLKPQ